MALQDTNSHFWTASGRPWTWVLRDPRTEGGPSLWEGAHAGLVITLPSARSQGRQDFAGSPTGVPCSTEQACSQLQHRPKALGSVEWKEMDLPSAFPGVVPQGPMGFAPNNRVLKLI